MHVTRISRPGAVAALAALLIISTGAYAQVGRVDSWSHDQARCHDARTYSSARW